MVEFGGWEMPIQYSSVLEEHRACREHAVAFDVSHLGSLHVQGDGALDLLQSAFTNDVGRIAPGQAQYTHLLDPADAHVVDDIIVWWLADDDFIVMPNASNTSRIADALAGDHSCTVEDITMSRAIIAVQGPEARKTLAPVVTSDVERFHVAPTTYGSADGFIAGTGYTGEDGVELHVPREAAAETWRAVVAAGIQPAGLGARDTLRLEAGLPLHGHELGPGITTLQAGLGWVVRWDKGDFRGRDALLAEKERGVDRKLRGLLVAGRQIPREGCRVSIDGKEVGAVTSGNISPMLQQGIALAFLPPGVSDGTQVEIDIRGRTATAKVVKPPFFKRA